MGACVDCGREFEQWSAVAVRQGSTRIRCRECYNAFARARPSYQAKLKHGPRKRGAKRIHNDARYKALRRQVLAEETICGFCSETVDKSLPATDKRSATIDHIVPLALNGEPFARDNVRLAHRSCNSAAGNRAKEAAATERACFARAALWIGDRLAS